MPADGASFLEWAVAGAPLEARTESGDLHVVAVVGASALVGAVDGLGHGPEAALAARVAAGVAGEHVGEPLARVLEHCHEALRGTRGAAMTLAAIDARAAELRWLGVGNVEGMLVRADGAKPREAVQLRGGIVGFRLPALRETLVSLRRGDMLVFATDGILYEGARRADPSLPPADIARSILDDSRKGDDDALVLVARFTGPLP
ncbi:MAG TPA: SpoIIE family protein phosphatase [Labilithrix sp.]|jgi:serine phosphatase RsbU (regulator of sigma subunit)